MNIFEKIIYPTSLKNFTTNYYEEKPLFVPGGIKDILNPFKKNDLEQLLWLNEQKLRKIVRVNKSGSYVQPPHHASGKDIFRWCVDQYSTGNTLIVNGIDHLSIDIARVTREMEAITHCKIAANAFMTPNGSKGFLPHFDTHDVFVFQLEGEKIWDLYDKRINYPVDRQIHMIDQKTLGEPSVSYRLKAGDLLYVPRGMVHGPHTLKEYDSLHITMGFRPIRWKDYLISMVDIISEDHPALRKTAVFADTFLPEAALNLAIHELQENLSSKKYKAVALDRLQEKFVSQLRPLPGKHIEMASAKYVIDESTLLLRRKEAICHVAENSETVSIQFPGIGISSDDDLHPGSVQAPLIAGGVFRFIANSNDPFTIKELPDILTVDTKITLVNKLLREGLLILV